jgi:hypothetical protein
MSNFLRRPGSKARWHYTKKPLSAQVGSGFGIFDLVINLRREHYYHEARGESQATY